MSECKHCGKMIYQDEPYGFWVHGSPDRPRMMLCSDDRILHAAEPKGDYLWIKDGKCVRADEDNPFAAQPTPPQPTGVPPEFQ